MATVSLCRAQPVETVRSEENELTFRYGKRYLDLNIRALDKYAARLKRQQSHMLSRLARKERRLMHKLQRSDSAAYARLRGEGRSFDSLSKLAASPATTNSTKPSFQASANVLPTIDSLKRMHGFLQSGSKGVAVSASPELADYSGKLEDLNTELAHRKQIEKWSAERMASIKSGLGGKPSGIVGVRAMEKTTFYASSRIKAYREIAESPTRLEEKALEYLHGTEGFDRALTKPISSVDMAQAPAQGGLSQSNMSKVANAAELERMGLQTKQGVQSHLQQKFENQLSGAQQHLGKQLKEYQQHTDDIRQVKQSFRQLKATEKPSFRINPLRGVPFFQRIEKGYNFQTTKPTTAHPALLDIGAFAGFKHTPQLSYGVGAAIITGLGQGWDEIRLSFQGIGIRSYARWEWNYGIAAYAGYERYYWKGDIGDRHDPDQHMQFATQRINENYRESMLIGAQKSYKINDRRKGAIIVLLNLNALKASEKLFIVRFATF